MSLGFIGIYASEQEVIDMIRTFLTEGYQEENFSVLALDASKTHLIEEETHVHDTHIASEEAFGLISGFLTGISGGFIIPGLTAPGIGPLIAAGPLASLIDGTSSKDIKDLLLTAGVNEEQAEEYVNGLNDGKIILFYENNSS